MSSLRRSFRRRRQRQQPPASPRPVVPRTPQPVASPARPTLTRVGAAFDYEHDRVLLACTRCRNADESGTLEDIIQLSHGPLPVELAEEWFTQHDHTVLVSIPAGVPVMGYCQTCQQRTPLQLLGELEASAAIAAGTVRLFGQDWDDEDWDEDE